MYRITGYVDSWSARPGDRLAFRVSSVGGVDFDVRFVRVVCPDPNPAGPGYREIAMPTPSDGRVAGREQPARLGSCGIAEGIGLQDGPLLVTFAMWPTTPGRGRQGIVAIAGRDGTLAVGIDADGHLFAEAPGAAGGTIVVRIDAALRTRQWYRVLARLDPDGTLSLVQEPLRPAADAGTVRAAGARGPVGPVTVTVAALPGPDGGTVAHFNGKVEHPRLARLLPAGVEETVAAWDFSAEIPTQFVPDRGPLGARMRLVNLPTRAMTGSNWTGAVHDWRSAPEQYGAIHFHDDDHGDMGWVESFALTIPSDWPSGFYAAHVRRPDADDLIPFFVRPDRPRSDVVFLVPTYTYQVYGNHVRPGRGAEIAERAAAWGSLSETPDMNPQFGASTYNDHSDGSGVSLVSMFRPMLDNRPRLISQIDPTPHGSGLRRLGTDGYVEHWLLTEGIEHDVVTDHDLHAEGLDLLRPYRVVITGEHPEYLSERMMDAFQAYMDQGGRLMYLGGNGFYWRAEPSEHAPHALEVRRAESGIRTWATEPGESHHAFGGGYGGLWRRIGRPAHRLVGVGFSAQGTYSGFPFRFVEGIRDPRVAFMTEGLEVEPGAVFGEHGFMGGGAAGYELDSVNPRYGTPENALVVAKGIVVRPDYVWVHEDLLVERHPRPAEDWSCADMTFFETPSGGAVFSVGSMSYVGALPVAGTVRRLTTNVLNRFRDPRPFPFPP
jgi:N,N-dimethylformamidase